MIKTIIQHLDRLVEQTNRPDLIALVFEIVFSGKIEYEKIIYPTTKIGEKPAILKQKKSSNNENFSSNLKWQASLIENGTLDLFMQSIPYNFIVSIIKSGIVKGIEAKNFSKHIVSLYSL